ncbi:MAG: Holliday junction resolvase RuvX [Bacilli bacterium]
MRILGLDLGSRTVGMAKSDPMGIIATPIGTARIQENDLNEAYDRVIEAVNEYEIEAIVLGLPKNMNGSEGFQSEYSQTFKTMLEKGLDIPIFLQDERLTTKMAHSVMIRADVSRKKRKQNVDNIAATIILQSYLDSH